MADLTQEAIRSLGQAISGKEAAEILAGYYNHAVAAIGATTDKNSARRSKDVIQGQRIWQMIQDLKARNNEIIVRGSSDFNQIIRAIGTLFGEILKLGGEAEVRYRASQNLTKDLVDGSLDFAGQVVDTVKGVGLGVKDTVEGALSLTSVLGRLLPFIVFGGIALVAFLYAKQFGLIGAKA